MKPSKELDMSFFVDTSVGMRAQVRGSDEAELELMARSGSGLLQRGTRSRLTN